MSQVQDQQMSEKVQKMPLAELLLSAMLFKVQAPGNLMKTLIIHLKSVSTLFEIEAAKSCCE